jgi:hypothetical protein
MYGAQGGVRSLAATTIGLNRNDGIRADSPFGAAPLRDLVDVEPVFSEQRPTWHSEWSDFA